MHRTLRVLGALILILAASSGFGQDRVPLLSLDHYVRVKSTAPDIAGQTAQIYVREVVLSGTALRGRPASGSVVLFVHGAGTPAEVSFDVPYKDYSWMAYLAKAGFDVFSMDMTGYGRSTRPPAMNDPCNLSKEQQARFVPQLIAAPCAPSRPTAITTMGSDWNDIGAVVDHLRGLRGVDKVTLVAWSQGGPRAGGYAARNPDKVARLVVLAPAYNRAGPLDAPNPLPSVNASMSVQSQADFTANWDRQVGCPDQYEAAATSPVWSDMLASDRSARHGVRSAARRSADWGFNQTIVAKMQTPFLMVAGVHDNRCTRARARAVCRSGLEAESVVDLAAPRTTPCGKRTICSCSTLRSSG